MDYLYIADFISNAEYLLKINARKRHELVMKAAWSVEDEEYADELDYEREELLEDIIEARDALSQCD